MRAGSVPVGSGVGAPRSSRERDFSRRQKNPKPKDSQKKAEEEDLHNNGRRWRQGSPASGFHPLRTSRWLQWITTHH